MESIDPSEAKTRLSALIERAAKGESSTITRHDNPMALLSPVHKRDPERVRRAIAGLREFSRDKTLGMDWRELRDVGRK
jgi:antitoxin (DNA-binding transcriptional repressor) of toxin-antitoxin stability system